MMHWALQLVSLVPYVGSAGGLLLLKGIFLPTLPRSCHCGGYLIGFLSLILSGTSQCTVPITSLQSAGKIWMFDFRLG